MDDILVSRKAVRLTRLIVFLSVLIPITIGFWLLMAQNGGGKTPQTSGQIALAYTRSNLHWIRGPYVQATYPTTVGRLQQTLYRHVPIRVVQDVNVRQLVRKYGSKPKVDLVVLTGVFNSLPPNVGVTGPGTVVALVDPVRRRVFFVTD